MKLPALRSLSVIAAAAVFASVARAHPGHDGHENGGFTWDFSHLAAHPLATIGCAALLAVSAWALCAHLRDRRRERLNRVRR